MKKLVFLALAFALLAAQGVRSQDTTSRKTDKKECLAKDTKSCKGKCKKDSAGACCKGNAKKNGTCKNCCKKASESKK